MIIMIKCCENLLRFLICVIHINYNLGGGHRGANDYVYFYFFSVYKIENYKKTTHTKI